MASQPEELSEDRNLRRLPQEANIDRQDNEARRCAVQFAPVSSAEIPARGKRSTLASDKSMAASKLTRTWKQK